MNSSFLRTGIVKAPKPTQPIIPPRHRAICCPRSPGCRPAARRRAVVQSDRQTDTCPCALVICPCSGSGVTDPARLWKTSHALHPGVLPSGLQGDGGWRFGPLQPLPAAPPQPSVWEHLGQCRGKPRAAAPTRHVLRHHLWLWWQPDHLQKHLKKSWSWQAPPIENDSPAERGFREALQTRLATLKQRNNAVRKININQVGRGKLLCCCPRKALDEYLILCPSPLHDWHHISRTALPLAAAVPHFGSWSLLQRTGGITAKETGMQQNTHPWARKMLCCDFYIYCWWQIKVVACHPRISFSTLLAACLFVRATS